MSFGTYCLFFSLIVVPRSSSARYTTPSDFLKSVPLIPKTVAEAVHRCPEERDSLVQNSLTVLRANAETEREWLKADSLRLLGDRKYNPATQLQTKLLDSLENAFSSLVKTLLQQLSLATVKPSENLMKEIQTIGERLDADIRQCPKAVGPVRATVPPRPPTFSYDSACVAAAEMNAAFNRRHEVQSYLSIVHGNWKNDVAPVLQNIEAFDKRIEQLRGNIANPKLIAQMRNWRYKLWGFIEETLNTVGSVTQLAAQFSR